MSVQLSMAAAEPVSWRDGVHITGTAIWCDARRARDVCFVSAPHAIRDPRHGQLIGSPAALALLERQGRGGALAGSQLAVPFGHPFTLGVRRLELFRSGHGVGGASLAVQVDDRRVVYAGAIDPRGTGLGGAADVRAAAVLVVRATYGDERFAFRPAAEVAADVVAHAREVTGRGGALVLLVSSPSKGLDVAAQLAALDPELPLAAHRAIHHAAQRLRAQQVSLPRIRRWSQKGRAGDVLLWPLRFRDKLAPPALPPGSSVALVSGAAADPAAIDAARADQGFAWSDQADAAGLRAYVEATGAGAVYLLDGGSAELVEALSVGGRRVLRLAAPQQMGLFRPRVA